MKKKGKTNEINWKSEGKGWVCYHDRVIRVGPTRIICTWCMSTVRK